MTFPDFWAEWPHKKNKFSAEKAFKKLKPGEREQATKYAAEWCKVWRKENPQASHIHASTYLNQKRFLDMDVDTSEPQPDTMAVCTMYADAILKGKSYMFKHINPQILSVILDHKLVTRDQCRKAGVL
jgi:hypothetical protein